jgi:hypothetical protein
MASPSTWKNMFSQHLLLKFLDTKFWQRERPPRPITSPKSQIAPPPQDIKQLQCFFGMVNFYHHFLPNCAQILKPLTNLLKGGVETLEWTASTQEVFQSAKCLLAAAAPLQHPAPNAELSLATDASATHIGGVMQQKSRPLAVT